MTVLVLLSEGRVAMNTLVGSLADMLLLRFGVSTVRADTDLEPEYGECRVLLDDPPPSLLFLGEVRKRTSSSTARDAGLT